MSKKIITESFPRIVERQKYFDSRNTVMPSRISKNKSTYKHIVVSQQRAKKNLGNLREKQIYHE